MDREGIYKQFEVQIMCNGTFLHIYSFFGFVFKQLNNILF